MPAPCGLPRCAARILNCLRATTATPMPAMESCTCLETPRAETTSFAWCPRRRRRRHHDEHFRRPGSGRESRPDRCGLALRPSLCNRRFSPRATPLRLRAHSDALSLRVNSWAAHVEPVLSRATGPCRRTVSNSRRVQAPPRRVEDSESVPVQARPSRSNPIPPALPRPVSRPADGRCLGRASPPATEASESPARGVLPEPSREAGTL